MVSLFEDRDHLGLFPIVGKGAGEDGAINNVGKRAKYDRRQSLSTRELICLDPAIYS